VQRALITVAANAAALAVAAALFDGIRIGLPGDTTGEDVLTLILVGCILGLINAIIAPVAKLLSLPFIILTLGLFLLLVNAAMLWLATELAQAFDLAFRVDGFWTFVWGGLVIALVVMAVNTVADDD